MVLVVVVVLVRLRTCYGISRHHRQHHHCLQTHRPRRCRRRLRPRRPQSTQERAGRHRRRVKDRLINRLDGREEGGGGVVRGDGAMQGEGGEGRDDDEREVETEWKPSEGEEVMRRGEGGEGREVKGDGVEVSRGYYRGGEGRVKLCCC